ncbi:MAG: hypothetical protein J5J06_08950 [Phycisphaerae bacterium]|nr:hypothetical protein [Phycisphaerae bacterium]
MSMIRGSSLIYGSGPVARLGYVCVAMIVTLAGCAGTTSAPRMSSADSGGFAGRLERGRGAPWTILCFERQGDDRIMVIRQLAETLRRTPGVRPGDVMVIDDDQEGFTRLYYGVYYRKTDPSGRRSMPPRMDKDLMMIKSLGTPDGRRLFLQARRVPVPLPDVGPPEWNLASTSAVYSLQVGVFQPTDDFWEFKQAAVDYCRALREEGYEAYYYHTPSASMVTVGTFGEDALVPQDRGLWRYSAKIERLRNSSDLLRYNVLNGAIYTAMSDRDQKVPVESRLVRVPRSGDGGSSWNLLPPS